MTSKRNIEQEAHRMIDDLNYRRQHGYAITPTHTVDAILMLHDVIVDLRQAVTNLRMVMAAKERQGFDGRG